MENLQSDDASQWGTIGRLQWLLLLLILLTACGRNQQGSVGTPTSLDHTGDPAGASTVDAGTAAGTSTAPDTLPPIVEMQIHADGPIYPGSPVTLSIQATDDQQVVAARLSIDGADTGWQEGRTLPEGILSYPWTAAEPGTYAIIGQARDAAGNVGEIRQVVEVMARSAPDTPQPTAPTPPRPPQVIVQETINVRSQPHEEGNIIGTARPGERFPATGRNPAGDWWRIDFDSQSGWVYGPLVTVEYADRVAVVQDVQPPVAATPTPLSANLAPAPAPIGTVTYYETAISLPTYPYERYQSDAFDANFDWPYKRFDWERFQAEMPEPEDRTYRVLVLENTYLRITVLPELGGRIWQVIHKPSGADAFYQNSVVKPTQWGPEEQRGWLALGGLEWNLPVVEHGYDWGTSWGYIPLQHSPNLASITVFTPQDGRKLNASITISLFAGAASFEVEPTITNVGDETQDFAYWHSAALAPGQANRPGESLRFVVPTEEMVVHSSQDLRLPEPGGPMTWPIYGGVNFSRLGNWRQYAGFFEHPAAHGPFAAVYDPQQEAGLARIFPATIARGSKLFGLGWQAALNNNLFTDDDSAYVELHGGLPTSFDDHYRLPAGGSVTWRETWYPVHGIDDLAYANEVAALHVHLAQDGLAVGLYPTRPLDGTLIATVAGDPIGHIEVKAEPDAPFTSLLVPAASLPRDAAIQVHLEDTAGHVLLSHQFGELLR